MFKGFEEKSFKSLACYEKRAYLCIRNKKQKAGVKDRSGYSSIFTRKPRLFRCPMAGHASRFHLLQMDSNRKGNLVSVDYKGLRILKSYQLGVSSHLPPGFFLSTKPYTHTKQKSDSTTRWVAFLFIITVFDDRKNRTILTFVLSSNNSEQNTLLFSTLGTHSEDT